MEAVIEVAVSLAGFTVVTVNVADVWPAGTITLAGTAAAAGVSLVSTTVVFTEGAAERTTVPVAVVEPKTDEGEIDTDDTFTDAGQLLT